MGGNGNLGRCNEDRGAAFRVGQPGVELSAIGPSEYQVVWSSWLTGTSLLARSAQLMVAGRDIEGL